MGVGYSRVVCCRWCGSLACAAIRTQTEAVCTVVDHYIGALTGRVDCGCGIHRPWSERAGRSRSTRWLCLRSSTYGYASAFEAIVLSKGQKISGDWIALAVYTVGLFWVPIRQSRQYWQRSSFWLVITGLLIVHLLAFIAILTT